MVEENEGEKQTEIQTKEKRYDFLKEAKELAARIEKGTQEYKELTERNEDMAARNLLGGRTDAGVQSVEKKEETNKEYKDRIMGGR